MPTSFSLTRLATCLAAMALLHCGGETSGVNPRPQLGDGGPPAVDSGVSPPAVDSGVVPPPGDSGVLPDPGPTGSCSGSTNAPHEVPPLHRAAPWTCQPTAYGGVNQTSHSCTKDADCTDAGADVYCVQGKCTLDHCYTDSDCAAGTICVCSDMFYGGNAPHGNSCISADCKSDGDCGAGGYCSPSTGYCGGFMSYHCHTPKDTCMDPQKDCGTCGNSCTFSPAEGNFVCAQNICAG